MKTYAVTVRWPAVAERVEYVDATSVEEACAIVMRGEAQDTGDIEYHDDDAGDHWIQSVELNESEDPRVPPVSLPVPAAHQLKDSPVWLADELLHTLRATWRALDSMTGPQRMAPAVLDVLERGWSVMQRAEEQR